IVHLPDARADEGSPDTEATRAFIELTDLRTTLFVALRKDTTLLGFISAHRHGVRPFSEKEIALLETFADQAVIAIENTRLINETREALEQQTATAEVLGVINSSPGDLVPVFDAMLERAIRLCDAVQGVLWVIDGERSHLAAAQGLPDDFVALLRERGEAGTNPPLQQIIRGERLIHFVDTADHELYRSGHPVARAAVAADVKTVVWVALVREGTPVGAFAIGRREVRPFCDKQIALLQNFAAQAVIAMENARLLTETREALERQTATAEVLGVINSSPGDLQPVFEAILDHAIRLCDANFGHFRTYDGEGFPLAAVYGELDLVELHQQRFRHFVPGPHHPISRLVRGERLIHIADATADEAYHNDPSWPQLLATGAVSVLAVALRKGDTLLGYINVYRNVVGPFPEKQISVLQNFAAQAVIAMQNARLLTETREALEQQTATAEVLQVINSSPGDLTPVFDAILDKWHARCGAGFGSLQTYDGEYFRTVAARGLPEAFVDIIRQPFRPHPGSFEARLAAGTDLVPVPDVAALAPLPTNPISRAAIDLGASVGTLLLLPLRRETELVGYIAAARQEVRPFTDKQIALLQNF